MEIKYMGIDMDSTNVQIISAELYILLIGLGTTAGMHKLLELMGLKPPATYMIGVAIGALTAYIVTTVIIWDTGESSGTI